MRTTVTIEDALYEQALEVDDPTMKKSEIFREAMKTFVRVQAAKTPGRSWRNGTADARCSPPWIGYGHPMMGAGRHVNVVRPFPPSQ